MALATRMFVRGLDQRLQDQLDVTVSSGSPEARLALNIQDLLTTVGAQVGDYRGDN